MTRKTAAILGLAALLLCLGFLGPDAVSVAQDCGGGYSAFGSCSGEGVIQFSPYYGGGCSGGGSSGGYATPSYYWPAVYYQQPIYAVPSYAAPYYGRSRYVERWRTPFDSGVYRSRGRWVCGPSGCYLEVN